MKRILRYCVLICCFVSFKLQATHIVGGEISYKNLSGNDYEVTLTLYRDCYNGIPPFENPAPITIFDVSGNVISLLQLPLVKDSVLPLLNYTGSCISTPTGVCVQQGTYKVIVNLPPIVGGYTLAYQRCCRAATTLNLLNPGQTGATYWTRIPGIDVVSYNNSPKFVNMPPLNLCYSMPNSADHSATDIDGDSLEYFLATAFQGLDVCCPIIPNTLPTGVGGGCSSPPSSCPSYNTPPPYQSVSYLSGYDENYPLNSFPAISINSQTGILSLTPTLTGEFVIGVGIREFRNHVLIGAYYRDYRVNVYNCQYCTGIHDISKADINIYPNPVTNQICLNLQNTNDEGYYTLKDITGKVILTGAISKDTKFIDIKDVSKGVYFLGILINNKEPVIKKIIKE